MINEILTLAGGVVPVADPTGIGDLIATYGPFAPFAALLLWLLRLLWADNKEKEHEIRELTETAMEKVIPLVLEATNILADAVETLQQVRSSQNESNEASELMEEMLRTMVDLRRAIRTASNSEGSPQKRVTPRKKV